ncbi:MAG: dihydroorotate dehydrogenase electron transfer subunit [Desulforhopalus sp.]|jgi:dihydroorotate dehydrogenase electron transfer subunit
MSQYQENATVTRVEQLSSKNYRLTFDSPLIAGDCKPGQFVMIRTSIGKDPLLRRPFSVHQVSGNGEIQVYFKEVGRGTSILAHAKIGDVYSIFGPLGRGFKINTAGPSILVGGGLGIAPLLLLLKETCRLKTNCENDLVILGGRSRDEVEPLLDDFKQYGVTVRVSTDDGSLGHHGYVTEILKSLDIATSSTVYACGPEPMMASIAAICSEISVACQVSVESVMACGMGACLGCSRPDKKGSYTHVCLNGPVFDAEKLEWNI